ncbi:hypothetical protein MKW94_027453 [Papaver nudicaule]|uniref:Eukaryotic translation initiation factor 2 subunit beta n=1 Tax=Papaver nudicaule TaxID=74823 RepID=A0AA42B2U5_PAPNU|nr:hypothetical protein [Papaver nudicaule]
MGGNLPPCSGCCGPDCCYASPDLPTSSSFSGLKKKKKKTDAVEDLAAQVELNMEGEGRVLQELYPLEGTERTYYEYQELLGRLSNMLIDNNAGGERRITVLRTPQVLREGTKKTVLVICKLMHREPEHVMSFYLAEMGTSGSLNGQQRLVVKGRFAPRNFELIQRSYVNEYIRCQGCRSPDTVLFKENRLFFVRCEECGSGRSVAPVKAGFVARVGRRN